MEIPFDLPEEKWETVLMLELPGHLWLVKDKFEKDVYGIFRILYLH